MVNRRRQLAKFSGANGAGVASKENGRTLPSTTVTVRRFGGSFVAKTTPTSTSEKNTT